jgi:hypothetical protein
VLQWEQQELFQNQTMALVLGDKQKQLVQTKVIFSRFCTVEEN